MHSSAFVLRLRAGIVTFIPEVHFGLLLLPFLWFSFVSFDTWNVAVRNLYIYSHKGKLVVRSTIRTVVLDMSARDFSDCCCCWCDNFSSHCWILCCWEVGSVAVAWLWIWLCCTCEMNRRWEATWLCRYGTSLIRRSTDGFHISQCRSFIVRTGVRTGRIVLERYCCVNVGVRCELAGGCDLVVLMRWRDDDNELVLIDIAVAHSAFRWLISCSTSACTESHANQLK